LHPAPGRTPGGNANRRNAVNIRIKTIGSYTKIPGNHLIGQTVIMVDVLRFSTCAVWALENGAVKVIPTEDPGEAASIASRLGDCLLAGERGGIKIPGFAFGNSPQEFTGEAIRGRNIVYSTTNGTAAVCGLEGASTLLVGALINCTAVARAAVATGNDIIIMCAGTGRDISADDIFAAGAIAEAILKEAPEAEACDMTRIACLTYDAWREDSTALSATRHYAALMELGFEEDVNFCLRKDITATVPVYRNGVLEKL